jgi:eukaryotic-like serine/threonine-protein kinase
VENLIGQTLGLRYELAALVQNGPIFASYSARDRLTGRNVGVRAIRDPFNGEEPFIRSLVEIIEEVQISSSSLEAMVEIVQEDGRHYLLTEMPKGSLLTDRIRRFAPFTVPVALSTALGIAQGLADLHEKGFAHGDVGAHNVIATHEGGAKLQLAGIWQSYSKSRTAGGAVLAQMAPYIAPEVCKGGQPGVSSDLYGLGIIMFQLLTGRVPFEGETTTATTMRHLTSPIPSLRGLNAAMPVAVEQVVTKLLAKDPTTRYQTATEVIADLRSIADQLRFGRTPQPKKDFEAPVVEKVVEKNPTIKKQPSAAKNNEPKKPLTKEEKKKLRRDKDVPTWLMVFLFLGILGAALGVGSMVYFVAKKPREIKMPNIKGSSVNEARIQMKKLKLNLHEAKKEPSDRIDMDRILSTQPAAGEMVREGGTVDIVISSGSKFVRVPDLTGMTADEAKIALQALNLTLDGKPMRVTDRRKAPGAILKQMPDSGAKLERFSKIRIWIAAPSDAPIDSLPGETDSPLANSRPARSFVFKHEVADVSWEVKVKVEFEDEDGTKQVYSKYHNVGDEVEITEIGYGKEGTFRVYYDDELKDTQVIKPKVPGGAR